MRLFIAILLPAIAFSLPSGAQLLSGTVKDVQGEPLPEAVVSLLTVQDSMLVRAVMCDARGRFAIRADSGSYLLQAVAPGKKPELVPCHPGPGQPSELQIVLSEVSALQGITVSASRPFIEALPGMMVVNVGNSPAAAGSNAFDLLNRSPAVKVDEQGNATLRGQSVEVFVDGKPSRMSGPQLVALLRSMTAAEIARLELITQPSARYDAAGSGGIINIRTQAVRKRGLNGTFSATASQGSAPGGNVSGRITYRHNKLTVYASEYFNYVDNHLLLNVDRRFHDGSPSVTGEVYTRQKIRYNSRFHRVKLGGEYALNRSTTIGIRAQTPIGNPVMDYSSVSTVNDYVNRSTIFTRSERHMDNTWYEREAGLLLRKQMPNDGEFTADAFYVYNRSGDHGLFYHTPVDAEGRATGAPDVWGLSFPVALTLLSSQADYTRALNKRTKLETGVKYTDFTIDNIADFMITDAAGTWIPDTLRSTRFQYRQHVTAAYLTTSRTLNDQIELQAGLRAEQTTGAGAVPRTGQKFDRSYLNLFPTVFASWKVDSLHTLTFSYGRRLDRPDVYILNPSRDYIDKYSYRVGNPALLPQYTNSVEVGCSYAGRITVTASATRTTGVISDFFVQDDQSRTAYEIHDNLSSFGQCGLNVNYNGKIGEGWTINAYAEGYLRKFRGHYSGSSYVIDGTAWSCNISNQFRLGKGWSAELSGWYNGVSRNTVFTVSRPMGSLDAGISRKMFHDSLQLSLAFQDILGTQRQRGSNRFGTIDTDVESTWDAQRAVFSLQYNFGRDIAVMNRRSEGDRRM